jgi:nicotinate dehydrogenase subunit A
MTINCHINGAPVSVAVEGEAPLLYVLRNDLGLKGTRFGCGAGDCGACMVLIDDRPTNACTVALELTEGKAVTTVEALAESEEGRALLGAFAEHQAMQCGYCISGILISALALLRVNRQAADAEIRAALDGHLCRCGSHHRILAAVESAASELRHG